MSCAFCGCPEDDAYETEAGGVGCLCGLEIEGVDPEDLAWGFHVETIPEEDQ